MSTPFVQMMLPFEVALNNSWSSGNEALIDIVATGIAQTILFCTIWGPNISRKRLFAQKYFADLVLSTRVTYGQTMNFI